MRIGIVTDIHEAIVPLKRALEEFRRRSVDQVVSLGDACDSFSRVGRAAEVVALLRATGAVGVWGNHDFGLARDVPQIIREGAAPEVLEYMGTMEPYLAIEDCRFSHVEPWLDANKAENLWYYDGPPDSADKAARSFAAVPQRCLFMGHLHRWLVMTPAGQVPWAGTEPLELSPNTRYLIVVGPVTHGCCAIYDTASSRLTPIACGV
jgi:hypothetical protein